MNLLIVSSTQAEISPFLTDHTHHKNIDFLVTGVGTPSTVFQLSKQLLHHNYDLVIQAGVAGYFNEALSPGETVLVTKDAFGDLGAFEFGRWKTLADMELSNQRDWLVNPNQNLLERFPFKKVAAITINTVTDNATWVNALKNKWDADIESMEGAALHYVCSQVQKPFLQLRSISNRVGDRDKKQWKLAEAIKNLNEALASIVDTVTK